MKPIPLGESSLERTDRIRRILALISLVTALVAALFTSSATLYRTQRADLPSQQQFDFQRIQAAINEMETLRAQIKAVQVDTQKLIQLPPDAKLSVQLAQMDKSVSDIGERLSKLESAILTTPAKALEIPLLQRDVENLRVSHQNSLLAVKEGVDRLYDINKWLLGALAISIITLALSNFLRPKESPDPKV
jgi:hypothetical protein